MKLHFFLPLYVFELLWQRVCVRSAYIYIEYEDGFCEGRGGYKITSVFDILYNINAIRLCWSVCRLSVTEPAEKYFF